MFFFFTQHVGSWFYSRLQMSLSLEQQDSNLKAFCLGSVLDCYTGTLTTRPWDLNPDYGIIKLILMTTPHLKMGVDQTPKT